MSRLWERLNKLANEVEGLVDRLASRGFLDLLRGPIDGLTGVRVFDLLHGGLDGLIDRLAGGRLLDSLVCSHDLLRGPIDRRGHLRDEVAHRLRDDFATLRGWLRDRRGMRYRRGTR